MPTSNSTPGRTAEIPSGFPRAWVEFVNPSDLTEVIKADLTWLTSRWTCLYGQGTCPGIYAERPNDGCCTLGAHYADAADEKRVERWAKELTPDDWQFYKRGQKRVSETDDEGERKTRVVDGGCIFLNRPGFPAGPGCALHTLALRLEKPITETKPDVCWQLPIRRLFREVERNDGTTYTEVTITEYERHGWGAGGHDFDWYCSSNPEAHIGVQPLYLSCADELTALLGTKGYAQLARYCEERVASAPDPTQQMAAHPATTAALIVDADTLRLSARSAGSTTA